MSEHQPPDRRTPRRNSSSRHVRRRPVDLHHLRERCPRLRQHRLRHRHQALPHPGGPLIFSTDIPVASTPEPVDDGRCRVRRDPNGREFDPNGIGTFDSDAHFREQADRVREDVGEVVLARLPARCATIACRVCETVLDEEGENHICHFDDIETARTAADSYGWTIAADGTALCEAEDCIESEDQP